MKLVCSDPQIFGKLLISVAKFVDQIHFEINQKGIRIKSIDPDDFCYVDLFLKKAFFVNCSSYHTLNFGIDVSKFSKFLPKLLSTDRLSIIVNENSLTLEALKKWTACFKVNFLENDPYDLPEPKKIIDQSSVDIDSDEFSKLVDTASAISNELKFTIEGKKLFLAASSGDYSFIGEPSKVMNIENSGDQSVSSCVIASYIKTLAGLINKCSKVRVRISEGNPLQLDLLYRDLGVFSFSLSNKRKRLYANRQQDRNGTSLPRLTITRLPEFLIYLTTCPDGERTRLLQDAGLETAGGDYSRMAQELGLAIRAEGKIKLTREGEIFTNLLQNDQGQAKTFLHGRAFSKIPAYKILVDSLQENSLTPMELFEEINKRQKTAYGYAIDKQDLSTLLGLAIWCEVIDKKLALYYLKREK